MVGAFNGIFVNRVHKVIFTSRKKKTGWNLLGREVPLHSAKTALNEIVDCLLTVPTVLTSVRKTM